MHKIQDRPVVVDGQIVIRPMMYLALSYDHRIVDGQVKPVTFLVRVKEGLERSGAHAARSVTRSARGLLHRIGARALVLNALPRVSCPPVAPQQIRGSHRDAPLHRRARPAPRRASAASDFMSQYLIAIGRGRDVLHPAFVDLFQKRAVAEDRLFLEIADHSMRGFRAD